MNITDKLADALARLYEIHVKPPSGNGYISDGMQAGNAWRKAKEALEAYRAQRDGENSMDGYRLLKPGEVIQDGDEFLVRDEWRAALLALGFPYQGSESCPYRRPLAKGEA